MITCNRCGSVSPASAINCQNCGAPLSNSVETGSSAARGFQEQPELPAWLESLRAGERPAVPTDNPSSFSTADLIEEGSLPSWMRSGRPELNDTSMSSPHLNLRPSSTSGPNTDDSRGINAQSLIDEKSLPSWMQENKQSTGSNAQEGIAASSLVQQDLMPDWMKSLQQRNPVSNPVQPSAHLPSPLSQAFSEAPQANPFAGSASEIPQGTAQGVSAHDLVDAQSLPSWMMAQEGNGAAFAQPSANGLLSSASLVDVDALPPWLRESAQQEQKSGGLPQAQTNYPWQSAQSPMQPGAMQQSPFGQPQPPFIPQDASAWQSAPSQIPPPPGMNSISAQGSGLSASSFIDPNALPQWLRSGNEQQNQMGNNIPPQQLAANQRGGYTGPPRIDNVRVPSRPRGEINPNEGNEAAANVFASMLGVASTSPNFPGSPPVQNYGMQPGQGMPASPMAPMQNPSPSGNMPGQVPGMMQGFNNPQQGMQGSPQPQGYAPGGFNNGMYQTGNLGQGNYPAGNSFPGASQYQPGSAGISSTPNGMGNLGMETDGGQRTSTKPVKKGWFDMIRDWFR